MKRIKHVCAVPGCTEPAITRFEDDKWLCLRPRVQGRRAAKPHDLLGSPPRTAMKHFKLKQRRRYPASAAWAASWTMSGSFLHLVALDTLSHAPIVRTAFDISKSHRVRG